MAVFLHHYYAKEYWNIVWGEDGRRKDGRRKLPVCHVETPRLVISPPYLL